MGSVGRGTTPPARSRTCARLAGPARQSAQISPETQQTQISDDLDVSTGKQILFSGGEVAKHVFWLVAGQVVIHANAHVAGIVLSKTQVTLQTSATLTGRIYAQALIAVDNNAITAP